MLRLSVAPAASVTTRLTLTVPVDPTTSVALLWSAFAKLPAEVVHLKLVKLRPLAAALREASRFTVEPAAAVAGTDARTTGRRARFTEDNAFSIPAPQVEVVQLHSSASLTTVQLLTVAPPAGKGVAPALIRSISFAGVSAGLTDRIKAATPATSGAEKLVPTSTSAALV